MERPHKGLEAVLTQGKLLEAAYDAAISNPGPAPGWDPFEIWRSRVSDAREQRPTDGDETQD